MHTVGCMILLLPLEVGYEIFESLCGSHSVKCRVPWKFVDKINVNFTQVFNLKLSSDMKARLLMFGK